MNSNNSTPGIIIAGTSSGSGKTTVTSAIMSILKEKLNVQPFKTGPDYIDPQFHTAITGNFSRNLDSWMLEEDTIKYLYRKNSENADISVIEGVMGLFDGFGIDHNHGSTAHIARILNLPVILTVDGRGVSSSIAATIKGFKEFDEKLNIAGVILNKIHGDRHYQLLKKAIEKYTTVPVLGYLNFSKDIELSERHLGLVPQGEVDDFNTRLITLRDIAARTLDIEKIVETANKHSKYIPLLPSPMAIKKVSAPVKIAVAYDQAFNFYYKDNLDLLESCGIEISYFSPMKDKTLPHDISGMILGGGFPEVFASQLSENTHIKNAIVNALSEGLPCYAECGGFMYLCRSIKDFEGMTHKMTGWFNMDSEMTSRLQRFGYINIEFSKDTVIGPRSTTVKAHEFHRSVVHEGSNKPVYSITKKYFDDSIKNWKCGFTRKNTIGGYPHIHFYAAPEIVFNFINNCKRFSENKKNEHNRNNKT